MHKEILKIISTQRAIGTLPQFGTEKCQLDEIRWVRCKLAT